MNFDFSWFTTIPGILITCGVVLLIVALVIFIVTSKKNKNNKDNENNNVDVNQSTAVPEVVPQPVPVEETVQNVVSPTDSVMPTPIEETVTPVETPVPTVVNNNTFQNEIKPEVVNETVEVAPYTPSIEMPVQETQVPIYNIPEPTVNNEPIVSNEPITNNVPVIETPNTVDITPTLEPQQETVTPTNTASNEHSIYGGVSQIIPNISIEQPKTSHQIYGGADPLENTQTLRPVSVNEPTVSQVSEPVINTTVEPTVNVIPTPTQEEIIPAVAPQAPEVSIIPEQPSNDSIIPPQM